MVTLYLNPWLHGERDHEGWSCGWYCDCQHVNVPKLVIGYVLSAMIDDWGKLNAENKMLIEKRKRRSDKRSPEEKIRLMNDYER